MTVYVLRCRLPRLPGEEPTTDAYWYVGWSNNVERRFREHRGELRDKRDRHLGAAWTHRYYPEEIVETRIGSLETETATTLEYMTMYGVSRVRGGAYSAPDLDMDQLATILPVECQRCGGHMPEDCPVPRTPDARAPYMNPIAQSRDPRAAAAGYLDNMTPAKAAHIIAAPAIATITRDCDPAAAARLLVLELYGTLPDPTSQNWHRNIYDIHMCRRDPESAAAAVLRRLGTSLGESREWYRAEHKLSPEDRAALATIGARVTRGSHPSRFSLEYNPR